MATTAALYPANLGSIPSGGTKSVADRPEMCYAVRMTPPYFEFQVHAQFSTKTPITKGQVHDLEDQIPEFYLRTSVLNNGKVGSVSAYILAQDEDGASRILYRELNTALDVVGIETDDLEVYGVRTWPMDVSAPGE
jgi:hypothetical protein